MDTLSGLRTLFVPEEEPPGLGAAAPPPAFEAAGAPLTPDAQAPPREASLDLFTSSAAQGEHEVLPHGTALAALDPAALAEALGRWRERMAAHAD
ncbi:MAG: hypothetical protein JWO90_2800, partial [Solirubrobacterales bacterium]|nr:hypothetical protein [Solirubrobacterales bacterium]